VERARLLADLEVARDQALEAARTKGAFVAAMSHEIRTPLNAILGMSDLLAQTQLDLDQREYVEIFRRCGRSLKGLLDNALELSRFETGRIELTAEPFEIDALIHECLEAFAFASHRKGIALVGDLAEDALGTVVGDEARLRQVIFNLIGNAVKFTESGRVVVRCRGGEAGGVEIEIADTGIGIPEDRQSAIFDRFVQAEAGTTRRFGGSGLGLTLCRELVEAMHGTLEVDSVAGEGSVFRLGLPLTVAPRRDGGDLTGKRIGVLLADDEERAVAAKRLRRHGAEVEEMGGANEVRALLAGGAHVDAILLDARLPGGGGLELLEQLEGDAHAILPQRVVLLPMDHRVGDLARCEAVGAVSFSKPARWEELDAALSAGLRPALRAAASPEKPPCFTGRRILLAEDVPENRTIVLVHLRPTGCELVVAEDGQVAFEKFARESFDLVLMDVHMPRVDGCEATRRIRAHEKEIGAQRTPVVALTADALPEQRASCLAAGCDAHLGKPFTRDDLYRTIRTYLGSNEETRGERPESRGGERVEARASERPSPGPVAKTPATPDTEPASFEIPEIPADLADLAEEYLDKRRADAAKLREAIERRAFDDARRLGHNMKGSGAGYGFRTVSELGARSEHAAARADASGVLRLAGELVEYAEKARAYLDRT
jgi:CheY-like chemotaxis protein/anti-sigma regulatory factor (Ser/Thr protein kinase)